MSYIRKDDLLIKNDNFYVDLWRDLLFHVLFYFTFNFFSVGYGIADK
jgi:hypothetical protein